MDEAIGSTSYADQRSKLQRWGLTKRKDPSSFKKADEPLVKDEAWRSGLVGKWKYPVEFRIHFAEVGFKDYSRMVASYDLIKRSQKFGFKADPNAVNVIFSGTNDDDEDGELELFPLNSWMLAHRVSHAVADKDIKYAYETFMGRVAMALGLEIGGVDLSKAKKMEVDFFDMLNFGRLIFYFEGEERKRMRTRKVLKPLIVDPEERLVKMLWTTKSAEGEVVGGEGLHELGAQLLVKGKITLKRTGDQKADSIIEEFENQLTNLYGEKYEAAIGRYLPF